MGTRIHIHPHTCIHAPMHTGTQACTCAHMHTHEHALAQLFTDKLEIIA